MEKTSYKADEIYNLDFSFIFAWRLKNAITADITDNLNENNN